MDPTILLQSIGGCFHTISTSYGLMLSLFIAGLLGSVTHCTAMCGPFVMAQSGRLEKMTDKALIPYHLGRITTYVIMAILLYSVLNLAFLFLPIRKFVITPILLFAAVIFLVQAFPRLGKLFPFANVSLRLLPFRKIQAGIEKLGDTGNSLKKYGLGILLGFMPCGLVVSAIMAAGTASSVSQAALAMLAFGVGTMPVMILIAYGSDYLGRRFPAQLTTFKKGFMLWSGLWLVIVAAGLWV